MLKKGLQENVDETVSLAIRFVKLNPCCICGGEGWCGVKYKGTCPIYRELKSRLCILKEATE